MTEHFLRLLRYDDWATRETAASVERAGARAPEKARKVLAHIIGAHWVWYSRVREGGAKLAVWPDLSPAECVEHSRRLQTAWSEVLASLGEPGLTQPVDYKNSKGEPWSSTLDEILTHLAMHGAHHRGQVATLLRDSGNQPAYTDYIHAVRNGLL